METSILSQFSPLTTASASAFRAALVRDLGSPLRVEAQPPPPSPYALPPYTVLVRIHAAGLNHADLLMMQGKYQDRPQLPFIPGGEAAGTILAVASKNQARYKPGDRVMLVMGAGAFCDWAVCDEKAIFPIPENIQSGKSELGSNSWSFEQAAAFPVNYGTAYYSLKVKGRVAAGDTVLVTGASGGTGSVAVKIAKALGATVISTCRGDEKAAYCRDQLRSDYVIDLLKIQNHSLNDSTQTTHSNSYKALSEQVLSIAGPAGIQVVFDTVGGSLFRECLKCIKYNGRILTLGYADAGNIPKVPLNLLLVKNSSIEGVFWGRALKMQPAFMRKQLDEIYALMRRGVLGPPVADNVVRFEEIDQIMPRILDGSLSSRVGKTVFVMERSQSGKSEQASSRAIRSRL